ncbi:hypothetical protein M406DRAFT_338010 [Cryphonectria parasitica EP155]|uniref:CSN8/PSMD8/EIF3K domain-containing protein n=1 Tax=Cryphonectria parasitica (strain ATCC 38755 / EP155) TaxID=660469 RepID=A0A9P4Y6V1_CRYP1|nr:uncharacterized protein M406DRAFT_338010 [Cryphonectria parasitica EP155]KAF3767190.1 hypothetical protein M406DRAFT_338010 [Cryphonectria parasitica EP155]
MPPRGPSARWQRLKPVDMDPLESMGLPSKGETRLLDYKVQEHYYTKIVERYLSFCSDASDRAALLDKFAALSITKERGSSSGTDSAVSTASVSTASTSTTASFPTPLLLQTSNKDLSTVLMALRKLREGIVASNRIDDFSTQAYLFCVRTAILVKHTESYHPAILHLLRTIHPRHPLTTFELREVTGYLVLDAACRRGDLAEAMAIRSRCRLHDPKIDSILRALARDDYIAFGRLRKSIDGHKAKFLEFCEDTMRRHTLKCFGRAYLSVDLDFLELATGSAFSQLVQQEGVGWHLDGTKVVIRSIKGRAA